MKQFPKIFIFMLMLSYITSTCTSFLEDINISSDGIFDEDYDNHYDDLDILDLFIDSSASNSNCHSRQFNEYESYYNAYKCCYLKGKCTSVDDEGEITTKELSMCASVTQTEYNNIDRIKDEFEIICSSFKINCNSSYLKFGFLSVIIILLL